MYMWLMACDTCHVMGDGGGAPAQWADSRGQAQIKEFLELASPPTQSFF